MNGPRVQNESYMILRLFLSSFFSSSTTL
eukprot:COSAG03_NODE_428_length_7981_cov_23.765542_1_plen_28_part_10